MHLRVSPAQPLPLTCLRGRKPKLLQLVAQLLAPPGIRGPQGLAPGVGAPSGCRAGSGKRPGRGLQPPPCSSRGALSALGPSVPRSPAAAGPGLVSTRATWPHWTGGKLGTRAPWPGANPCLVQSPLPCAPPSLPPGPAGVTCGAARLNGYCPPRPSPDTPGPSPGF